MAPTFNYFQKHFFYLEKSTNVIKSAIMVIKDRVSMIPDDKVLLVRSARRSYASILFGNHWLIN